MKSENTQIEGVANLDEYRMWSSYPDSFYSFVVTNCNNWNSVPQFITEMIIDENVCNDITSDFNVSNFTYLRRLHVNKNSLKNLNSLRIENDLRLKSIVIAEGNTRETGSFFDVSTVIIKSSIRMDI